MPSKKPNDFKAGVYYLNAVFCIAVTQKSNKNSWLEGFLK
jgi:hypothetical protein